ncbi:DUF2169 domain-containing protein [Herbaspirillum sp. DW155]|uniref:DUF2169 domain-containing protein n=1 Tax=Herbaspirillum sp. DW155 TaxID=3095609 RepID=UPI0030D10676
MGCWCRVPGFEPLCEADEFFGEDLHASVRQESDLCLPYKPRCDVIVNATAYPPAALSGKTPYRFTVRVVVIRPDAPAPLPPTRAARIEPVHARLALGRGSAALGGGAFKEIGHSR